MKQPHEFSRRILLAVSGMSPQIVTETLYAIAVTGQDMAFIPTEVHLITTGIGSHQAELQLLHPNSGQFHQLCRDYQLPGIQFDAAHIHVIEDQQGNRLDDIKTPSQNEAAADFITHIVSQLTADENVALHVSIAGGRKTMGYYLGYALSLYGRPQDRLSHVLVTEKYESLRDFFYPTPESRVIYDRDNKSLDTQDAKVMLAEIPFVRMRGGIPQHLLEGKTGFNESVKFARQIQAQPCLQINLSEGCIQANDINIRLTDVNYAFYLWLLQHSLDGEPIKRMIDDNRDYADEFLALYGQQATLLKDDDRTRETLKNGMSSQWLSERI
ncbi:MAG: CRISPR-associated ring nuclease Csm6, partial [Methyloprofundus sp.]|nr:CRISPR-associated ring nuclease Csm6 [Methyloprofundus sp.]